MRSLDAIRDLFGWVLFEAHIETLEVWTAVNALLWGLWVLNPWVTIFDTAPGFRTMAAIPEWIWGLSAILASCIQLTGRLTGRPALQRLGARSLAALWMFAAGALAWENWRWLSSITYPMLAVGSLLVSYRSQSYPKRAMTWPLASEELNDANP